MEDQKLLEMLADKVEFLKKEVPKIGSPSQQFELNKDLLRTLDYQFFELEQTLNNTNNSSDKIKFTKQILNNLKSQIYFTNTDNKKKIELLKDIVSYLERLRNIDSDPLTQKRIEQEIEKSTNKITEIEKRTEVEGKKSKPPQRYPNIDNIERLIQECTDNINKILKEIITRKDFLKYGILIAIPLVLIAALSNLITSNQSMVVRAPKIRWKLKSGFGEYKEGSSALFYDAPNRLKKKLSEMTDERFILEIEYKKDNENGYNILSDVSQGNIECSFVGPYYENYPDLYSLYFNCTIPFGLTAREHIGWLSIPCKDIDHSDILECPKFNSFKQDVLNDLTYAQTLYKRRGSSPLNIIPFPLAATGEQIGGWFMEKIDTLEQLKKVKMRIPAMGAKVLEELDVRVITDIPENQIINQLKREESNTILAAEWINPYDDFNHGLNDTFIYFYYPAWWEPSTTFELQVNFDEWNDLPSNYRAIFKSACWEIYLNLLAEYDYKNWLMLEKIKKEKNNTEFMQQFSDEILKNAYWATEEVIKEYSKKPDFKEVYEKWYDYKQKIQTWSNYLREVDTIINITEWKKRGWNKETQ